MVIFCFILYFNFLCEMSSCSLMFLTCFCCYAFICCYWYYFDWKYWLHLCLIISIVYWWYFNWNYSSFIMILTHLLSVHLILTSFYLTLLMNFSISYLNQQNHPFFPPINLIPFGLFPLWYSVLIARIRLIYFTEEVIAIIYVRLTCFVDLLIDLDSTLCLSVPHTQI